MPPPAAPPAWSPTPAVAPQVRAVPPGVPERFVANGVAKLLAAPLKLSKAVAPMVNVLETAVASVPSEAVRV